MRKPVQFKDIKKGQRFTESFTEWIKVNAQTAKTSDGALATFREDYLVTPIIKHKKT